jgi:hypothetical protein
MYLELSGRGCDIELASVGNVTPGSDGSTEKLGLKSPHRRIMSLQRSPNALLKLPKF